MPKILLIEDNEMNRDMLSRRLERKGFEVCSAIDGPAGIAAAGAEHPDLILMDVGLGLGKMDGWEATRRIKAQPTTAGIPIIALTAHTLQGDRERCLEAGMDGYVSKPIRADELADAIHAVVKPG